MHDRKSGTDPESSIPGMRQGSDVSPSVEEALWPSDDSDDHPLRVHEGEFGLWRITVATPPDCPQRTVSLNLMLRSDVTELLTEERDKRAWSIFLEEVVDLADRKIENLKP